MKKIIIFGVVVVLAIVIYNIFEGDEEEEWFHYIERTATIYDVSATDPVFVNAYIDASGSMKGYFSNASDARFITALANAKPNKTMWMNSELTELKGIPTNQLLTHNFRGGDSQFDKMLGKIIKNDSLQKSGGISLLFTDGILSASTKETNKNPEYIRDSHQYFINYIADVVRKEDMAVAVYQLKSKYNGTYWNYQNNPVPNVVIEDRPFYVIAIAKPAQLRHFIANEKLGEKLSIAFGNYETSSDDTTKNVFYPAITNIGKELELNLTLPDYIANLGNDYLTKNLTIELDNKDITSKLKPCWSIQGSHFRISKWLIDDLNLPMLTFGSHELTIKVKKENTLSKWKDLSSEDDKNIKTSLNEQGKTFYLQHLLKGLKEGTEEPDSKLIFSSTIKFNIQ